MSFFELPDRPVIKDIHDLYRGNKATVLEVVQLFQARISDKDSLYKSVLRETPKLALKLAEKLDEILESYRSYNLEPVNESLVYNPFNPKIDIGNTEWFEKLLEVYPLFGVPFMAKDNILVQNEKATAASKILENFVSPYNSNVYSKIEQAGGILIAQTNMDEFAFGSSTEKSAFQITKNPFDLERVPGGTSGGSAAAVAAGFAPFALGSDTGGSVRQPSSFCATVGIRPTYGLVSRFGVMASTSSFDQVGPITNSVLDNALVLSVLQGKSENDQTSLDSSESNLSNFLNHPSFGSKINKFRLFQIFFNLLEAFGNAHGIDTQNEYIAEANGYIADLFEKKPVIGIPVEYFGEGLSSETGERLELVKKELSKDFEIKEISLPLTKYAISVYYILQFVESTANLERFDGVRYGKQIDLKNSDDLYFSARDSFFGPEVKRRIMLGTYASSAGYYDAYYNKACQVRELMRQDFLEAFKTVDVLLMPTAPSPAFKIGSKDEDPLAMYLGDIMTITQPPSRLPSLVVPAGLVDFEGSKLPVGVQLVGPELSEDVLYRVGRMVEKMEL